MTTAEFWAAQPFSYLVTYSFNRGPKLAALHEALKLLFRKTRQALLTAPAAQLPAMSDQLRRFERSNSLDLLTQAPDAFNITATPIAAIQANTPETTALAELLHAPVVNQSHWMCGPTYRDALAFYDTQDKLISVLNICFECDRMLTGAGEEVRADETTYHKLRRLLTQLGHPIEAADKQH